jgi:CIC family chloride channel protein
LGVGYAFVGKALNGQMVLGMMALLVVLKLVATSACYASGNAGGIFGPSLFIGAMLGGAFGAGAHALLPDYTGSVGAYALVGMGTAFAGIVRVPLTSTIMIFETTRDYSIVVPLMISNLVSYFVSSRLQEEPIYEALLHQDGIHLPPGARDREEMLLVSQGMRAPVDVLSGAQTVEDVASHASRGQDAWPVVENGKFLGMLTPSQVDQAEHQARQREPVAALLPPVDTGDPDMESYPRLYSDDPLDTALRRMALTGLNILPVVSRADIRHLVGTISSQDILAA